MEDSQRLLWEPARTWSPALVASYYRGSRHPGTGPRLHRVTHYRYVGKSTFQLMCHLSNPRIGERGTVPFWVDYVDVLVDHSKLLHRIGFNISAAEKSLSTEDLDSDEGYNSDESKPTWSARRRQSRKITGLQTATR